VDLGEIVAAQGPDQAGDGNGVRHHHQKPSGDLAAGRFRRDRIDAGPVFQKLMIAVTLLAAAEVVCRNRCGLMVRFLTKPESGKKAGP
jgi:hypothetical protein